MKKRLLLLSLGIFAYFLILPTLFLEGSIYLFTIRKFIVETGPSLFDISETSDFVINAVTISLLALFVILAFELPINFALKQAKDKQERKKLNILLTVVGFIGFYIGLNQLGPTVSTTGFICTGHPHSWTKSRMSNLKSAMLNYKADLGSFPFAGTNKNLKSAYKMNIASALGSATSTNCLYSDEIPGFKYLGLEKEAYLKRWKGPYLDGEPIDYMCDLWDKPFRYFAHEKNIYIQSAGKNGIFDPVEKILQTNYGDSDKVGEDDILVSISRVRKQFLD